MPTDLIDLATTRARRSSPLAAPNPRSGRPITAPFAPPLRAWDVHCVVGFGTQRGTGGATASVRLAIEIDPTADRWRVAIARDGGSETVVLESAPRDGGPIMDFLNELLSAAFPAVGGADTLVPFSGKDRR